MLLYQYHGYDLGGTSQRYQYHGYHLRGTSQHTHELGDPDIVTPCIYETTFIETETSFLLARHLGIPTTTTERSPAASVLLPRAYLRAKLGS